MPRYAVAVVTGASSGIGVELARVKAFALVLGLCAAGCVARAHESAIELGPGIEPPKQQTGFSVKYPAAANEEDVSGVVVLRVVIDEKGRPRDMVVVSSPDDRLTKAAKDALRSYRYSPATRGGELVAVWIKEEFPFISDAEILRRESSCDPRQFDTPPTDPTEDMTLPTLLRKAEPQITEEMRRGNRGGDVVLACTINACGRPQDCRPLKSAGALFTQSAIDAVAKWRYSPAMLASKPVNVYYTVRVTYRW